MIHRLNQLNRISICAILTSVLVTLCFSNVKAQESINATGGNGAGADGSVSYSIGQVFYITATGTNGSLTQGVQQPFEISVITAIENDDGINLSFMAYPNPATEFLTLEIDQSYALNVLSMSYQLFDIHGKLLHYEIITGHKTNITLSNLIPAIYFLKIFRENKDLKTFKIIKK